ncbi:MAG TPA: phosphotransferase [Halioglobus sp.]
MSAIRTLKPSRIPTQWEQVTPEWMTAAIANRHPEARVADVTILTVDDGTNRRARFGLNYAAGSGPTRVFLKAHAPGHRIVHLRNGNLFNEARLFASGVAPPMDHPLVYKSIIDYLRLDFLLVMEDLTLRSADPRDATRPMTVEQVAHGLRGLARLHSQYWGLSPRTHPQLRWVKTWKPAKGWQVGLRKRIPIGLERAAESIPAAVLRFSGEDIVALWSRYVRTLARGSMTMLHGDAHIGNTYVLPDGDVGFLDWQVVRRGNWSQDVGYFLVSALTEEDRRGNEKELVELYRGSLEVPREQLPTAEQAWLQYRSTPAYGLAIWLSTLGTDGWQSREISLTLAQRFAAAFVELDSLAALQTVFIG